MRFQGGTRTGSAAAPNSRSSASQPVPSSPSTIMAGRCGAKLALLFAGSGVVGMGVAVLQQVDARLGGQRSASAGVAWAGTTASASGTLGSRCSVDQPVERRRGIGRVVVAPPQLGGAAGVAPARGLLVEGLPAAHGRRCQQASGGRRRRRRRRAGSCGSTGRPWRDRRRRRGCRPTACPAAQVTMPRSASQVARSVCSVSRAVPNGTSTARSAQHSVSTTVL